VLSIREREFVEAARMVGASRWRIYFKEILPNLWAPILITFTLYMPVFVSAEAALSFLGVGIPPPTPSWGNMLGGVLAEAFRPPWWIVLFPGLAIIVTALSLQVLGDGIRDLLDPRLRRTA
jgi:ABC-type dipeptide/oligopeptide/nickel transport system permease subunit